MGDCTYITLIILLSATLCSVTYLWLEDVFATSSPTASPTTSMPSFQPTASPSPLPSASPSESTISPTTPFPTPHPPPQPTSHPSVAPTANTASPTLAVIPTPSPTLQPTHQPTLTPTTSPTTTPTTAPTEECHPRCQTLSCPLGPDVDCAGCQAVDTRCTGANENCAITHPEIGTCSVDCRGTTFRRGHVCSITTEMSCEIESDCPSGEQCQVGLCDQRRWCEATFASPIDKETCLLGGHDWVQDAEVELGGLHGECGNVGSYGEISTICSAKHDLGADFYPSAYREVGNFRRLCSEVGYVIISVCKDASGNLLLDEQGEVLPCGSTTPCQATDSVCEEVCQGCKGHWTVTTPEINEMTWCENNCMKYQTQCQGAHTPCADQASLATNCPGDMPVGYCSATLGGTCHGENADQMCLDLGLGSSCSFTPRCSARGCLWSAWNDPCRGHCSGDPDAFCQYDEDCNTNDGETCLLGMPADCWERCSGCATVYSDSIQDNKCLCHG